MAGHGKGAFRIAIEDFLETFEFEKILFKWHAGVLEKFEDASIDVYAKTVNMLYKGIELPPNMLPANVATIVKSSQNGFFAWLLMMGGLIFGGFFGLGQPSGRVASYFVDSQLRSFRPPPVDAIAMGYRGKLSDTIIRQYMNDLGIPNDVLAGYLEITKPLLTAFEYQVLWRREAITESDLNNVLGKLGMSDETINAVKRLGDVIPGPQDLITMAVREAVSDEISARFRHDEGFPAEFALWAKRQGLSEEWAHRFWRTHWQLPGPSQVFEMLHRLRPGKTDDPVTADTVSEYLKTADFSPFWRDKLQAISFSPFTRVDVRRMYKTGVLNDAQVKDAYLDLGYDQEHAQALTEFTIAFEAEEESGVVRSSVTSAYKSGFIDRTKADEMLSAGGYDATTVAFYLDSIDFTNALDIQNIKLMNIKKRYIEGVIDETTVNQEINMLNLPGEKVIALLELWTTERNNQTTLPTVGQTETFYEMGIITRDDFIRIFKLRGYTQEAIEWTLKRIDLEAQAKAKKIAEDAQKEADSLSKSKTASVYQKNKADLDLEIAKAKAELTDIAVALHEDIDAFKQAGLAARQDELKQYIAAVNVSKAELVQALAGTRLIKG
jgi:hypothetical protein